jgi:arylsulfatase
VTPTTGDGAETLESPAGNEFTGRVNWVQIDVDEAAEDLDHLITPEERLSVAMLRQ